VESNEEDDYDAMEAEDVQRQYEEKGYVEYEIEEEDNAPAPASIPAPLASQFYPASGRRRHRPGVARKSGTTRGSIE
jgi:hypothetical protein